MITLRTKQTYRSILPVECFKAFKDCLAVMQGAKARGNLDVPERNDAWRLPKAVCVLKHKHVIGKDLTETKAIEINFLQFAV